MLEWITLKPYDRYDVSTLVVHGDTVHIGHFGGSWDDEGQKLISVEEQMLRTFGNLEKALREIGSGLGDLVKVTVILKDMADFQEMHRTWKRVFLAKSPVRTTLTSEFVENHCRIQIDGMARKPSKRKPNQRYAGHPIGTSDFHSCDSPDAWPSSPFHT